MAPHMVFAVRQIVSGIRAGLFEGRFVRNLFAVAVAARHLRRRYYRGLVEGSRYLLVLDVQESHFGRNMVAVAKPGLIISAAVEVAGSAVARMNAVDTADLSAAAAYKAAAVV